MSPATFIIRICAGFIIGMGLSCILPLCPITEAAGGSLILGIGISLLSLKA